MTDIEFIPLEEWVTRTREGRRRAHEKHGANPVMTHTCVIRPI